MILGDTEITFRYSIVSVHWRMMLMITMCSFSWGGGKGESLICPREQSQVLLFSNQILTSSSIMKQRYFLPEREDVFYFF